MANKDNTFTIVIDKTYQGFAPLAHLDPLTEVGNGGHASVMTNADVLTGLLTQGPALSDLTNGTQAGVVTELINFIMDKAVSADATYGIGATKLYQISSTAVASSGTWPHTITGATDGESCVNLRGNLYYFYNKASGADIGKYDLASTFDDDWGSTVPTGFAALQSAPHPVAVKEDLMVFGNGRYGGVYIDSTTTLYPTRLDFGTDNTVDDVIFDANYWLFAVNSGVTGTNRTLGQIFAYDAAGLSSILADEAGIGYQRIGFLYPLNGVVYVAYQDLSSAGGYKIGYLQGRRLKALAYFTGALPNFAQKTLYKETILFLSSGIVWSAGAVNESLPFQLSQIADGGYATCGAMAAPFGTPMIASTDGGSNYRLAKFSGFDVSCTWKSIIFPVSLGKMKGYIDDITVLTKVLGANARCDLTIEANQAVDTSNTLQITTTGKTRHHFSATGLGAIEDFRVALNWANGSATNDAAIRKILISGHYVETT